MTALIERQTGDRRSIPIETVDAAHLPALRRRLTTAQRRWLGDSAFSAAPGTLAVLCDPAGKRVRVLVGVEATEPLTALAGLPCTLPAGSYHLADEGVLADRVLAMLGWALGAYQFTRYRQPTREPAQLAVAASERDAVLPLIEATTLVRDLVNTPAEDMGPAQLGAAVKRLGRLHKAKVRDWIGDELLKAGFPTIHAVGRASHRPPQLIELSWGKNDAPKLVVIGKGVCFDTGGLDLKTADGMRNMKKDMGGAAHAIALAGLIMQANLPVRLTLLIPAVDNAVAGNALRPGDIVSTRAGLSVEIDNTDAEGRLVLCDAIHYGAEQQPELLIDFATLTGAARVALGADLPALFANRDDMASDVLAASTKVSDPLWRMPLWRPYRKLLESSIADFANAGPSRHAGAITAALYLERFVPDTVPWLHLDTYAWNDTDRAGRPRGGEALGLRAMFAFLQQRYPR